MEEQKWIPVGRKLPEPFVSVLGYSPDEAPLPTVHECYVDDSGKWHSAAFYGMENVTHWMEMPGAPGEPCVVTNGDRVRTMSDEELAKFLESVMYECPFPDRKCDNNNCADCWLERLKAPAGGEKG